MNADAILRKYIYLSIAGKFYPCCAPSIGNATNGPTSRTAVANNGAASKSANTTDSLRNSSRRAAKAAADKKATKTTSDQAPPVTGFKYYRDLGQK